MHQRSARRSRRRSPEAKPASTGPAQRRRSRSNVTALRQCRRPRRACDWRSVLPSANTAKWPVTAIREVGKVAAISPVMAGPARNSPRMRRRVGSAGACHNDAAPASNGLVLSKMAPVHVMPELRNGRITYQLPERKRRAPPRHRVGRRAFTAVGVVGATREAGISGMWSRRDAARAARPVRRADRLSPRCAQINRRCACRVPSAADGHQPPRTATCVARRLRPTGLVEVGGPARGATIAPPLVSAVSVNSTCKHDGVSESPSRLWLAGGHQGLSQSSILCHLRLPWRQLLPACTSRHVFRCAQRCARWCAHRCDSSADAFRIVVG